MKPILILSSLLILHHLLSLAKSQNPNSFRQGGQWRLLQYSIGISGMHMQLLPNNKVVIFDRTDFGTSNISLPGGRCRVDPRDLSLRVDCSAHSVLYDFVTNTFRPLMVQTDTWCSSGALTSNGSLIQTGGFNDGELVVRRFSPCNDDSCDWVEYPNSLATRRWYSTNQILPDNRIIIVGGRRQYDFEFYPPSLDHLSQPQPQPPHSYFFEFLRQTSDESENNLYPFVHLLPDGNLFIFANTRSVSFNYRQNNIVKEFPAIPGDNPRNYPSTGSSVLLPLDENHHELEAEILICGGAPRNSFRQAGRGVFIPATTSCGRIRVTDPNPSWVMDDMPMARVMGDMLLLPNGDVLIINGGGSGTAGWENARNPVTSPLIYRRLHDVWQFFVMSPSPRPRLYHSSAILLIDGRILVGGSNPHPGYNFSGVEFPTDLSLEAFSPPYLSPEHEAVTPRISYISTETLGYRQELSMTCYVPRLIRQSPVSVRLIAPSFATHSFSMNQRMVVLRMLEYREVGPDTYELRLMGPSAPEIAPPGHYMLFLVHGQLPSQGMWVRL